MSRNALVTGGSDGVGLSLVRALVRDGFAVHFVGSNLEKGLAAADALGALGASGTARFWQVDLSDLGKVRDFTEKFSADVHSLDRLIFSAGLVLPKRQETAQGFEKTIGVNYLSAFLVAHRLKGLLFQANKPRVLFVAGNESIVLKPRLDFSDLQLHKHYSAAKSAMRAVHAKTVLCQILAEDWKGRGVHVNAFHPGAIRSSLGRNLPWPLNTLFSLVAKAMPIDTKIGIEAMLSEEYSSYNGTFFENKKRKTINFAPSYCEQLRQASVSMCAGFLE